MGVNIRRQLAVAVSAVVLVVLTGCSSDEEPSESPTSSDPQLSAPTQQTKQERAKEAIAGQFETIIEKMDDFHQAPGQFVDLPVTKLEALEWSDPFVREELGVQLYAGTFLSEQLAQWAALKNSQEGRMKVTSHEFTKVFPKNSSLVYSAACVDRSELKIFRDGKPRQGA